MQPQTLNKVNLLTNYKKGGTCAVYIVRTSAMKTFNVGIIGFGYMGLMHAMSYENLKFYYKDIPSINIYAVAAAESKLATLPIAVEKHYTDWRHLVEDEQVDIVDICSPNHLHAEMICAAIKAGKHIYCEKPLAVDLKSARQIMAAMRETGYKKTSRLNFQFRFIPAVMRAKQLLDEGAIGKLVQFNFKYYGSEFVDPGRPISWQTTRSISGGGVLYALGTHSLDLIRYLVGDVSRVFATHSTHFKQRPLAGSDKLADVEIEDIANIQLDCNGVPGMLLLSQVAAGAGTDFTFEIYGERGAIKFDQSQPNHLQYFCSDDANQPFGGHSGWKLIETSQKYGGKAVFPPPRVNVSVTRYHIASVFDFVDAAAQGKQSYPDILDGFRVQELTDAIYRSAKEERPIDIKAEDF